MSDVVLTKDSLAYVHAAGNRLHRGSRQACRECTPKSAPTKDTTFRCAVCADGLRACSCAYGHHNEPIRHG